MVSKVPLPNYRADLDERHGSTQKEVQMKDTITNLTSVAKYLYACNCHLLQIRMSTETERRVGNLLNTSGGPLPDGGSPAGSSQGAKQSLPSVNITDSVSTLKIDTVKEKLSIELKDRQEKVKVNVLI